MPAQDMESTNDLEAVRLRTFRPTRNETSSLNGLRGLHRCKHSSLVLSITTFFAAVLVFVTKRGLPHYTISKTQGNFLDNTLTSFFFFAPDRWFPAVPESPPSSYAPSSAPSNSPSSSINFITSPQSCPDTCSSQLCDCFSNMASSRCMYLISNECSNNFRDQCLSDFFPQEYQARAYCNMASLATCLNNGNSMASCRCNIVQEMCDSDFRLRSQCNQAMCCFVADTDDDRESCFVSDVETDSTAVDIPVPTKKEGNNTDPSNSNSTTSTSPVQPSNETNVSAPTYYPTLKPTAEPTSKPTKQHTLPPTKQPTLSPTKQPTLQPTLLPTFSPTKLPTLPPTSPPTLPPTTQPTLPPTKLPTKQPTNVPSSPPIPKTNTPACHKIEIELLTDKHGEETGYTFSSVSSSSTKNVLLDFQKGTFDDEHSYVEELCVPAGTYELTFNDVYGGICCFEGEGHYLVRVDGKEAIFGGNFKTKTITHKILVGYSPLLSPIDEKWLIEHNTRREAFHLANNKEYVPLKWSTALADEASNRADVLLNKCSYVSPNLPGGENVAFRESANQRDTEEPENILARWVDSKRNKKNPGSQFTQVMWRSTQYLGCSSKNRQRSDGSICYVSVCRYVRSGNCNMNKFNGWKEATLADNTPCGPVCPNDGCH